MKKLALIAALLIMALGVLVFPAAAQSDLTTLAGYFPSTAPFYLSFRTDDATIQTIDSLSSKFGSFTPGGVTPGSVEELLDEAAANMQQGGTFATTIRPWLGDTAAIGINSAQINDKQLYTVALSITDQDKADAFFDSILSSDAYSVKDGDGFSVYAPKSSTGEQPYFIFRSDVLLITTDSTVADAGGEITSKLTDNPDFGTAMEMLPAEQYSAVAYSNTPKLLSVMMQDHGSDMQSSAAMMGMFGSMMGGLKPQAFGLTLLDNHSVTFDAVTPLDPDASGTFTMKNASAPIDPAFAQHIPASAALVAQGTDLYNSYKASLANVQNLMQMMQTNSQDAQNIQTAFWGLGFLVRGLTGLEVDDAFGWMTGDYAMYLGFTPAFSDSQDVFSAMGQMPIDFGVTIEATDPAAAQKVIDGLTRSLSGLPSQDVTVTQQTLDSGVQALDFSISSPDLPFPIELMAATGNGVFAFGTPHAVNAALDPQNQGLDQDASYTEASQYFLDKTNSLFFVSGSGLEPLAHVMTASDNPQNIRQQGKQVQAFLDLLSSGSISQSVMGDGTGLLARFVWTMPAE